MQHSEYSEADIKLMEKYEDKKRKPVKGYVVDYFGCKLNVKYFDHIKHMDGKVLDIPIPSDGMLHEFLEYLSVVLAVDTLDPKSFVAIELGAGHGPWIARSGVLAKRKKVKKLTLVGVEGDKVLYKWMADNLKDNGLKQGLFSSSVKINLLKKLVSTTEKVLYFPKEGYIKTDKGEIKDWGAAASQQSGTDYRGFQIPMEEVPAVPLNDLLQPHKVLDLIHVDIQGYEYEVLRSAIDQLDEKARIIFIGTHSRKVEGDLIEMFHQHKWVLRHEKTCEFIYNVNIPSLPGMTRRDGTQMWINPRFEQNASILPK